MELRTASLPVALTPLGIAEGRPVLVIPGGPCRPPEYLTDFAGLGEQHPLVVLHPRGTPASGGLSRGWWTDAEDVVAAIDALGLDAIDIIGHSAGTRLSLAVATRFPHRVRSLALVTPPATWLTGTTHDGEEIVALRTDVEGIDGYASVVNDEPETQDAFEEVFHRQAPATYAHWTAAEQAHASIGRMSLAAAEAWFREIPANAVELIRTASLPPALIVGGDVDLLTGRRPVEEYAAVLGAELAMISDCGHYPWVEKPNEFRRILDEWLTARA
ncbi:alpha/beta hydrolase [Microbacterium sp. BG28]|uniref:alpha/beta fold hydrolase n=1 Tax=Microbacterium sp. BG28 TaxID=3097356 RepID=UPI002A5A5027|nr:alpha/beta hydrolase [Microbacterium sp. BG28]MDY0827902.1 alpha/beta hydrolase [Microbacterium sp. BG28]